MKRDANYVELISRQKASGLSVRGFCSNEGIAPAKFYYWQKKLRKQSVRNGFIPLLVKPAENIGRATDKGDDLLLEVCYPNGITLRIKQDLELAKLRALITLLD